MTAGSTLLAFDFDGTLAPICDDPAGVQMTRGAAELLHEASHLRAVVVAISSGRDVEDILSRTGAENVYIIGSHGLEIRGPGGVPVRDAAPLDAHVEDALREDIEANGLRLERKKHGIALHWRGLDAGAVAAIAGRFREWARHSGLELIEGRCVVEARRPGAGKEEALRWLTSALGATRVIYAGDDITDFGALRFAASRGRGVFVANGERVPPPDVTVVDSFRELFRLIREEVSI